MGILQYLAINKLVLVGGLLATAFLVSTIVLAVLKVEVDNELGVCVEERAGLIQTCDAAAKTTLAPTTTTETTTDQPEPPVTVSI